MSEPAIGVRAAVLTAAQTLKTQTFPVPSLGEDDALIRVEVCGLGGSDVTQYLGKLRPSSTVYPVILGHVFVGTVESAGPRAARRWGVDVTVDVDREDVVDVVRHVTGRIVLIGLKRGEPVPGLVTDELIYKDVAGTDAIGVSVEPGRA